MKGGRPEEKRMPLTPNPAGRLSLTEERKKVNSHHLQKKSGLRFYTAGQTFPKHFPLLFVLHHEFDVFSLPRKLLKESKWLSKKTWRISGKRILKKGQLHTTQHM